MMKDLNTTAWFSVSTERISKNMSYLFVSLGVYVCMCVYMFTTWVCT